MNLLQRIKQDLKAGWLALRYGTVRAAHRALEETELLRLRMEVRKLDGRINELCRDIGERALALHERGELSDHILTDREILKHADEVRTLRAQRAKLLAEMDETRSPD